MCEAFQLTAAELAQQPALRMYGDEREWTWAQYADAVRRLAAGLAALGVRHGDPVASLLVNRPEFHLFDTAAMHLGAPGWSLYNTSALEQMAHALEVTGSRVLVTEQAYARARPRVARASPGADARGRGRRRSIGRHAVDGRRRGGRRRATSTSRPRGAP